MNASFLGRLGFLPLGISAWIGLAANVGVSGSTAGTNTSASTETGEPDPLGIGIGGIVETVWYVWTAPADGAYSFTTAGSSFDAELGVYTGTAVNALTLQSLKKKDVFLGGDVRRIGFMVLRIAL